MHTDLVKLVDSGKLNPKLAERLDQLSPGSYLQHNAWGVGKVVEWDLRMRKLIIDFERRPKQHMDLQFAIDKTTPIADDDFLVKKVDDMGALQTMAKEDPVTLVAQLLESHDGSMTVQMLEDELVGGILEEGEFNKWWAAAKRALRKSSRVSVPSRRTEPLTLRDENLSLEDVLFGDFNEARDMKSKVRALDAILENVSVVKENVEQLQKILQKVDEEARKGASLHLGRALEMLALRDQLIRNVEELEPLAESSSLAAILKEEEERLGEELGGLAVGHQQEIYQVFPEAFGEDWIKVILQVFNEVNTRGAGEIAKLLEEHEAFDQLLAFIRTSLRRYSLGPNALVWVIKERKKATKKVFGPLVGNAILSLLEIDHLSDGPRTTSRLQSLLNEDKKLLGELVENMGVTEAMNFGRRLMECPVFGELDRKSLLARIIRKKPEVGELVSGEGRKKDTELIVSWESLKRKQEEYEDLVRNKIPQNVKDIAVARSYGDLRENFEYQSAKDMQKVLARRRVELQRDLDNARGTDFKDADTASVNIGTKVTLRNEAGEEKEYTILGAWDGNPPEGIISYLSSVGKSLLHKKVGETVNVIDYDTEKESPWTITAIAAYVS